MSCSRSPVPSSPCALVALIATCDRPHLLETRSLPSIREQSRPPDLIVVVDDSRAVANRSEVQRITQSDPASAVLALSNTRTPGASGAWNTGITRLLDEGFDPDRTWVALLDDDDRWLDQHLASLARVIDDHAPDVVAAPMLRLESPDHEGHRQEPPRELVADKLLAGNPHVQGSNLVVRLSTLLRAGLFDERLPSCTDRDLCLRLIELEGLSYRTTEQVTVHHFADPQRPRLSTPGTREKTLGLTRFWDKWRHRMTPVVQQAFRDRARRLFGWREVLPETDELVLVVGVVADRSRPRRVSPLLADLRELAADPAIAALDVVLIANGPLPGDGGAALQDLVEAERSLGLRVHVVDHPGDSACDRLPIAASRTMLQQGLYHLAETRPGAIAWVLDDDKRLGPILCDGPDESPGRRLARTLLRFRRDGTSVVLGQDVGAAPLPPGVTLRTQLVDLLRNLEWMASLRPDDPLPDRSASEAGLQLTDPDVYYDLSSARHDHLETATWWTPCSPGETVRDALGRLIGRLGGLRRGEQVFRPLHCRRSADPVADASPSVQRGGCTFVLDVDTLLDAPNVGLETPFGVSRRSDAVWATLQSLRLGRVVLSAPIAVRHDRSDREPRLDAMCLGRDVMGHAFHEAVRVYLETAPAQREERALRRYSQALDARLSAVRETGWRLEGLLGPLQRLSAVDALMPVAGADAADRANREVDRLTTEIVAWLEGVRALPAAIAESDIDVVGTLGTIEQVLRHARSQPNPLGPVLSEQRRVVAASTVRRLIPEAGPLRFLGAGAEGVVFTDGQRVYKSFDYWKVRCSAEQRTFLAGLVGRWSAGGALHPILKLRESGLDAVLVYPYESTSPYEGGHGAGLLELLRDCRRRGLVCNNLHPKNLRVTESGVVRLIDYGSDIAPLRDEARFDAMCRRAWLCFRWWFRSDLRALMRDAVRGAAAPELTGWERLRDAVLAPSAVQHLDELIVSSVERLQPDRVVDYGCGKAKLLRRLTEAFEFEAVGYDPDPALPERWALDGQPLRLGSAELLTKLRGADNLFDLAVCCLVLCTLREKEYRAALNDLRALVRPGGSALIAVCNPFFTLHGSTPFRRRITPEGACCEGSFEWDNKVRSTGRTRREVHRPWARLKRDLLAAGFVVRRTSATETVDVDGLLPNSDFLLIEAERSTEAGVADISLVIKCCALEADTIEAQTRHLLTQLEGPTVFVERILAVDAPQDEYPRRHGEPDVLRLESAVRRLLRDGVIDRVVREPDGAAVGELNRRWFGLDAAATHTVSGSQVASTLAAFEAVSTRRFLQIDADLMVARIDRDFDLLGALQDQLDATARAITVSLPIVGRDAPPDSGPTDGLNWRVEVRGALFDRERLLASRPWSNEVIDNRLALAWYRAMDRRLVGCDDASWRIHTAEAGFVHPPNAAKTNRAAWMAICDRAEAGHTPPSQRGNVDLVPSSNWWTPQRTEPFVFVVQGRNTDPGKLRRCLDSIARQEGPRWGVLLIDDGSTPQTRDGTGFATKPLGDRVTLLRSRWRAGKLGQLLPALRGVCGNPSSVLVFVDADDELVGSSVLERLDAAYQDGADLTVGSMVRTDKEIRYPVTFDDLRAARGGNVWQHLRSFRRGLLDLLPDHAFEVEGAFPEVANDWALMVPLVEIAQSPRFIEDVVYVHEPSERGKGAERPRREAIISGVMARPPLRHLRVRGAEERLPGPLELAQLLGSDERSGRTFLIIRHSHRPRMGTGPRRQRDAVPLDARGEEAARAFGWVLGDVDRVLSSPIPRCMRTAELVAETAGFRGEVQVCEALAGDHRGAQYEVAKRERGWSALTKAWLEGQVPTDVLAEPEVVARQVLEGLVADADNVPSRTLCITHDFHLLALERAFRGTTRSEVPYLGGLLIREAELLRWLATRRAA